MTTKLQKLVLTLDTDETDRLVTWMSATIYDLGLDHLEMCLSQRPHSHSCDCDCGADDLMDKILKILEG